MGSDLIDRRKLFRLAGAAGVGGAAVAAGLATPAGAVTAGRSFYPITPYRSYDSRNDNVVLLTNEEFDVDLITDEFGDLVIPVETAAVTYNLTIAATTGQGFLGVFPADFNWPGNSSINWWQSGLLLANGGTTSLGFSPVINRPGSVGLHCGGGGSTAFIIDVTGYYL
jgi:hypothetical protein